MTAKEFQQQHGRTKRRAPKEMFPFLISTDEEPLVAQPKKPTAKRMRTGYDGSAVIGSRLNRFKLAYSEEFLFSKARKYRADFYVPALNLLIEYEGATHRKGGHSSGDGIARDCEKANLATVLGYRYVRFTVDLLRKKPLYFESLLWSLATGKEPSEYKGELPAVLGKVSVIHIY